MEYKWVNKSWLSKKWELISIIKDNIKINNNYHEY